MGRLATTAGAAVLAVCLAGCGGGGDQVEAGAPTNAGSTIPTAPGFGFTGSSAIAEGRPIDERNTCDGDDFSPRLRWTGAPAGTKELALVVEDLDAEGFTHWLAYNLRSGAAGVPQGVPNSPQIPGPTPLLQGRNSFGDLGYQGPCPPEGETHTYRFRVVAIDAELNLPPGIDRVEFDETVEGHVIAEAVLDAPYTRS